MQSPRLSRGQYDHAQSQLHTYKLVMQIGGAIFAAIILACGWFVNRNVEVVDDIARRIAAVETRQSVNETISTEIRSQLHSLNAKMDRITNQQNTILRRGAK